MIRKSLLALSATALALSACSSSGGGDGSAPSQSAVEAKLRTDSELKTALGSAATSSSKVADVVYTCIAKVLVKDADKSDLRDYVAGKKSLDAIGGSSSQAKTDVQSCVTNGIKGGVASASPSA